MSQVGEENVEMALKVLNDRYVKKLIKKMCKKNILNGQSTLTESGRTADTNLSSVGTSSYSTISDSNLHSTSTYIPTALQGTS